MVIRNKKTGKTEKVTAEQWEAINAHPAFVGKYEVVEPDKPAPPTPPEAKEQTETKERKKVEK